MSDVDRFIRFLLDAAAAYHAPRETPRESMWTSISAGIAHGLEAEPAADSDAALVEAAASYHAPPVTPHEDMWRRIEPWALRGTGSVAASKASGWGRRVTRRWLPTVVAASLVIGVAIERVSGPSTPTEDAASSESRSGSARDVALKYATVKHLGQAETLLAAFRAGRDEAGHDEAGEEMSGRARELLGETRLLIDTPAERPPRERALLDDLELILAQIAALGPDAPAFEREIVFQGLERKGTLERLQVAAPPGSVSLVSLEGPTDP